MPNGPPHYGWRGAWFGAWFGPSPSVATTGGSGGSTGSGSGSIITGGFGSSQLIVQGYGSTGILILGSGGILWGGTIGASHIAITFLQALVTMLRSSSQLTTAIGGPRIYSTWPGPKTDLPFLVIEDYVESQPGETIEHNVNTVSIAAYGADKTSVKSVLMAAMNSTDSPAQNNTSSRVPLRWSLGIEESCWRQPTLPPMRTKIRMRGTDLWTWKIQYEFNILPYFQV